MIRFGGKEIGEARIFRAEGFGLFALGCLPAQASEMGSVTTQGPPSDSAVGGTGDGVGVAPRHRSAFLARWGQIM